jgi:hypothetical protein
MQKVAQIPKFPNNQIWAFALTGSILIIVFIIPKSEKRKMAQISFGVSIERLFINSSFVNSDSSNTFNLCGRQTKDIKWSIMFLLLDVVHENEVGGSSIIWLFPLVIADSERDMPGIDPWATRLVHQRYDHWAARSEAISWPWNSGVPPTIALL